MTDATQSITILPQIEDLLYPLKSDELAHLEASIQRDGVREPLCVWDRDGELILIDGHHRYAISQKLGVSFKTIKIKFESLEDVLDWVDKNQLGRRNLTDEERSLTIGRVYQRVRDARSQARQTGSEGGDGRTVDAVANEWRVSSGTVKRSADFADAIEQMKELGDTGAIAAQKILAGDVKDAITELPKVMKKAPGALQLIADRIADGSVKIKDAIKGYEGLGGSAPQVKPDNNADASQDVGSQGSEPSASVKGIGEQDFSGIGDFSLDDQEHAVSQSTTETNANAIFAFDNLRSMSKTDASTLWLSFPEYVRKELLRDMGRVRDWIVDLSRVALGDHPAQNEGNEQ
ncbi:ParB N-terminal domain-containing protein [Acidithiobacillus ferridurans]|uniref:ParB N-terminal domain-containing protein n=1 Tax=Acidithiobacillus ferridurans TaxID=1232575 RepID=A0A8X8KD57_ACIFI|nr:ParB N-terminal domain-containing protein [Acidithiobacillus ferridurans]MBU2714570.1 ParB N-terminal domain-containing protein [Acidithiobacillus ferridurans]MBU2724808.1 ParB N-terminal domain-containing protein [Acidithiobacillus ferridurans]MBU2725838.1 ParB N-terminal domain-containing protein [Acidithiobacillus ferridurans]